MYCTKCGKEIEEGASFCGYCGTPWEENSVGDEGVPPKRQQPAGREEAVKFKSKKRLNLLPFVIIGIVAAVLLVIAVTGMIVLGSPAHRYDRQLSLGEKYLDELDYEKAISAYKAAIEIDPKNPEAYRALAELYLATGDTEAALAILQEGYAATESKELEILISEVGNNAAAGGDSIPADTHSATVTVLGANETGAISGATVTVKGGDGEYEAETDSNGKVTFNDLSDGNYSIECKAEGYYDCTQEFTLSGAGSEPVVAMVPEVSGDDAYVVVRWNGDHDLDLCAFNTDMKEYVNIGHPIDSAGNVFLYADHGADMPFETIYLHNISAELVKSFFITEAKNAREGSPSGMEADGVTISVYSSTGLIYTSAADPEKSAALWCPCYCYAGQIYDQQDYIDDASGEEYAWISFDEKDAVVTAASQDDGWKRAYLNLLFQYGSEGEYADDGIGTTASIFYLDDDDIPEISIVTGGAGPFTFGGVYSYADGGPVQLCTANATMIPGDGMLYEYEPYDSMGGGDGRILKWDGKSVQELWYGSEYVDEEASAGSDGFLREYTSNGKGVTQEEYEADIAEHFVFSKAVTKGTEMTYGEAVAYLSEALWGDDGGKEWKQAYLKVVNDFIGENGYDSSLCWGLLFIDNDNIPELIWDTGTTAMGESVYTYSGDEAVEVYHAYSPISYILGDGLIYGTTGHGVIYENVVRLANGEVNIIWEGVTDANESYMGNVDAKPIYYSDSVEVTEEEYNRAFADAFSGKNPAGAVWLENPSYYYSFSYSDEYHNRAVPGMTTEEIIAYLTTEAPPSGLDRNAAQQYLEVMDTYNDDYYTYTYNLVYINNDDVPELVVFCEAEGAQYDTDSFSIYSYQDGKTVKADIKTDGYGDFYKKNTTSYYEKKDYISSSFIIENVEDSSDGYGYRPVFDHSKEVLSHWNWNYWDGQQVIYEAWYRDGNEIKENEYDKSVAAFTNARSLREGSMSEAEMTGLLQNAK